MTTWWPFCRRHFRTHFLELKCLNIAYNFTEGCPHRSNWQYASTGSRLVTCSSLSYYVTQWWPMLPTHICVTLPQWVHNTHIICIPISWNKTRCFYGWLHTVYPKKYAHDFCFVVLCCGYTLTDFPISIRLTSLPLWQSNDCPSASKAALMNMDKYFMWIHYERLHNHNKAKHNKTVCIFLGIYCINHMTPSLKYRSCHFGRTPRLVL